MNWKKSIPALAALGLIAIAASIAIAQDPRGVPIEDRFAFMNEPKFSVIIVFRDEVTTMAADGFRYQPDARFEQPLFAYLDRGVIATVQHYERSLNFRSERVYSAALRGFAGDLTLDQIRTLKDDPRIAAIVPDGIATINQGNRPGGGGGGGGQVLPWGIKRIGADQSSTKAGDGQGEISNVHVYIIDSGADADHADLNVVNHVNFAGGPNKDCNGHGTHVAGTVAARDNTIDVVGVAPGAPITGVKVLGCGGSGSWSGVISGIDWVTADAAGKRAIANMSLGGGANDAVDAAVKKSADSGVFYAVAAGNDGANACNYSPARAGTHNGVMTVAATASNDSETSWSNYGSCVDIWAPGASILSTKSGGGTTTMSGTSMASPHVGGTGALYLSGKTGTAAQVEAALKQAAGTTGTSSKDGTPIKLVWAGSY
jgi:aqualysin 1